MKIAVTSATFSGNSILRDELNRRFKDVKYHSGKVSLNRDGLVEFLRDVDAVIIGLDRIDDGVLDRCPKLKVIAKYGVGLDNVDLGACKARGVQIGWRGGINRLSVAELTLSFMLGSMRNVFRTAHLMKGGQWIKDGGRQLTGTTIGLIGIGHIGKEVIRLLEPFNCRILVNDIIDQSAYYRTKSLEEKSKEEIFSTSDIISIHTPYTPETRHLINEKTLSLMKTTAFLINTARGEIVSQEDLKRCLQEGRIAGAALDVYEMEPPTDLEFLKLPNLVPTPHIGGNSGEAVLAMGMSAIEALCEELKYPSK